MGEVLAPMESVRDLLPAQRGQDFCAVRKPHFSALQNKSVHASQNNSKWTRLSSSYGKQASKEGALTVPPSPSSGGRGRVFKTSAHNILSRSTYARLILTAC